MLRVYLAGCTMSTHVKSAAVKYFSLHCMRKALSSAGNAGCTLITRSFARQLGLVDMHGNPTQAYSRTIRVQGVVAGAFEMIKTLNITYELKGACTLATGWCCRYSFAKPLLVLGIKSSSRVHVPSQRCSFCRQENAHHGRLD